MRKRRWLFGGLSAQGTGLMELGGQCLNPLHHLPLLRQRRQRDENFWNPFDAENAIAPRRAGTNLHQLLSSLLCLKIIQQELWHAAAFINSKSRIACRTIHPIFSSRHDGDCTFPREGDLKNEVALLH